MIARTLAAGLMLVSAGLVAAPVETATASGPAVTAESNRFTPASIRISVGQSVVWGFPDAAVNTTTSDQEFWDSDAQSNGSTFSHSFQSAGTYPYHSRFRQSMTGKVVVPVARTGSTQNGWTLTWATTAATGSFDVQVRKGTKPWRALRTDTASTSAAFARKGTWKVRVRTQDGQSTSGWSPVLEVTTR